MAAASGVAEEKEGLGEGTPAPMSRTRAMCMRCTHSPGESDAFADGSGAELPPQEVGVQESLGFTATLRQERKRISGNPPAGDVRRRELSECWLAGTVNAIAEENRANDVFIHDKRVFGLAKQTSAGLAEMGIKYEMTAIANLLRDAYRLREDDTAIDQLPEAKKAEAEKSLHLLDACLQFNLNKVIELLGCRPKRRITFGQQRFT